ncbi:Terpene cyclase [Mycena sanguinolenta]|uniref:Terpene synthase n=1 Tax=Mycena sanguinolenta TaxID=230812 RepID=A0A8H7CNF2_9AGAR|nr:Terpene cyclase [Mycena sanguinolenta]
MEERPLRAMYLPDPMNSWPWPRQINPHYREVTAQSTAWLHSLKLLGPKSQRAFDRCETGLLAALAYPTASKEHLRTGCDLLNLTFLVDEYSEMEDSCGIHEMVEVMLDALCNPHKKRPAHEMHLGEAVCQFWNLALETASESSQKHFVEAFTGYLYSIMQEADECDAGAVLTIAHYLDIRSRNIGAYACFIPGELHLNLPDHIFYNPVLADLRRIAAQLLIVNNDLMSYNKEQAIGRDEYNFLAIIMRTDSTMDLPAATSWLSAYHESLQSEFIDTISLLPSFGLALDREVQEYTSYLANWPRAQDCWNFESTRYFGNKGLEIQVTRKVPLFPKLKRNPRVKEEGVTVQLVEL